jgi:peptidoglycan/LPS O-acetylase OafA/YrhL
LWQTFIFWRNTSGYFANGEEMPLLHAWSLAVEEQFYLVMPLFLVMAFYLSAPRGRLLLPVAIVAMFGSLASLSGSCWHSDPTAPSSLQCACCDGLFSNAVCRPGL